MVVKKSLQWWLVVTLTVTSLKGCPHNLVKGMYRKGLIKHLANTGTFFNFTFNNKNNSNNVVETLFTFSIQRLMNWYYLIIEFRKTLFKF